MSTSNTQRRWIARQALLLVATCVLLVGVMLLVRRYCFTIYADPVTGDRVVVNRLDRSSFEKGDRVVFAQKDASYTGFVEALPGDTIMLKGEKYLMPTRCICRGTDCVYCRYYLVNTSSGTTLVGQHAMTGKAYKLY